MVMTGEWRSEMSHSSLRRLIPLASLLCLLLARDAVAQNAPKVIAAAKTTAVDASVIRNLANGETTRDDLSARMLQDQFANVDWVILDSSEVVLSKNNQELFRARYFPSADLTYFQINFRDKDRLLNGTIHRNPSNPAQGFARVFLTTFAADGSATTAILEFLLTFTM
jgi:hypothetical protein